MVLHSNDCPNSKRFLMQLRVTSASILKKFVPDFVFSDATQEFWEHFSESPATVPAPLSLSLSLSALSNGRTGNLSSILTVCLAFHSEALRV